MNTLPARIAASALLLALASSAHAGSIKKWVDAEGRVHYGDRPPAAALASEVKIRKGATVPDDQRVDVSPQAQLKRLLGVPDKKDDLDAAPVGEDLAANDIKK